jgi:hypothetical protein
MRAILIDPWKRSLETIRYRSGSDQAALEELHRLVDEDCLDFAQIMPGECIVVGDHSALHNPPWPYYFFHGFSHRFYGRGVVLGFNSDGSERETKLTVDDLSVLITWP